MRPSAPTALVTDGGAGQGRSALAAVRLLAAGGWAPSVTTSGRWSLAGASASCAGRVPIRGTAAGAEAYRDDLRTAVATGGFDVVVPASDAALVALEASVAPLLDKATLAEAAGAVGLETPESHPFPSWAALVAATDLEFPIVVKPRRTTAVVRAFDDRAALLAADPIDGAVLVQPKLADPMSAFSGVLHDGALVAAVHQRYLRTWPHPCGTASAAVTVAPDLDREDRVARLLGGHDGVFQAQFVGDRLVDLNPRVYGSLPLAAAAGVNLVALASDLAVGRTAPPATVRRARAGVRYRWLEGDLRHVLQGLRRRRLGPRAAVDALRPRAGTAHSITTVRDPAPLVARLAHAAASR